MRDLALSLAGVALVIGTMYWGRWLMGSWLHWQSGLVIIGLVMVETGVWQMARQDCLPMPTSPALRVEVAHLVTHVQALEAAARANETADNAPTALDDTRAAIRLSVDRLVDVAETATTGPDQGHLTST